MNIVTCPAAYVATLTTTPPCICGDFNHDGVVDNNDYFMFIDAFGACVGNPKYLAEADFDRDGCITLVDYQAWLVCYRNANGKDFVKPIKKTVQSMPAPAHGNPQPMGPTSQ